MDPYPILWSYQIRIHDEKLHFLKEKNPLIYGLLNKIFKGLKKPIYFYFLAKCGILVATFKLIRLE